MDDESSAATVVRSVASTSVTTARRVGRSEGVKSATVLNSVNVRTFTAAKAQMRAAIVRTIRHARDDATARHLMTEPGVGTIVALSYVTGIKMPARSSALTVVGAYLGMTLRRRQSGEIDVVSETRLHNQANRVSKCSDGEGSRSVVRVSQKVLPRRNVTPSDVQAWGQEGDNDDYLQTQRNPASHVDAGRAIPQDGDTRSCGCLIAVS